MRRGAGSALLQLRDSTAELLELYFQGLDRSDNRTKAPNRRHAIGNLAARVACHLLQLVNDELRHRIRLQRAGVDERRVIWVGPNEPFKFSKPSDQDLVGAESAAQSVDGGDGDRQVRRDDDFIVFHDRKTPYVARAATRYVTGAILTASRWLQRKSGVGQATAPLAPSDTTGEAGATAPAPASPPRPPAGAQRQMTGADRIRAAIEKDRGGPTPPPAVQGFA